MRPKILSGERPYINTPEGKLYVMLNENADGELKEIICTIGKSGEVIAELAEVIGTMGTALLNSGYTPSRLAKKLRGIKSGIAIYDPEWIDEATGKPYLVQSIADGVAIIITEYIKRKNAMQPAE